MELGKPTPSGTENDHVRGQEEAWGVNRSRESRHFPCANPFAVYAGKLEAARFFRREKNARSAGKKDCAAFLLPEILAGNRKSVGSCLGGEAL